jgi:IS30 family transposase
MKKVKRYGHIKKAERSEIAILLKKGYSYGDIAGVLSRNKGTISREIKRNSTNGVYDPDKAEHKARVKRLYSKYQGMKVVGNKELRNYVEEKMKEDWSPEEISGRIKEEDRQIKYISPKGIYKFVYSVYGRRLGKHLAYRGKKKSQPRVKATKLAGRIFIDQRPKIIDKRKRFGDWEGDFIVSGKSGKGVLLVLHERKSRYALIKKIVSLNMKTAYQYIFEMTGGIVINTLTLDNDIIFRKHEELSRIIGVPVYFCHPYHSWEKGGVENTNKLVRRYIPKGSDISKYSDEYIQMIQEKLNSRPRKCIRYKTPKEIMLANNQFKFMKNIFFNQITGLDKKSSSVALEGST